MSKPYFPGAMVKLLPEAAASPFILPTQVILHTAVDQPGPTSLYPYFSRGDVGAESHFFVTLEGVIEQYMPVDRRANANRFADKRAISIETEDDGDPEGNPWTPAQIDSLIRLLRWANREWKIPMEVCTDPYASGIGWHSMWSYADPVNLVGVLPTSPWTLYRGKTCPGKARIRQFLDVIFPSLVWTEDDMFTEDDRARLNAIFEALFTGAHNGPMAARLKEIHEGERVVSARIVLDQWEQLAEGSG